MKHLYLSDELGGSFSDLIFIKYSGEDYNLANHEINAQLYARSIKGYANFLEFITNRIFAGNVEIKIVGHKEGSFESILSVIGDIITYTGSIAGILAWIGITPTTLYKSTHKLLIYIQKKIVELIIRHKGNTDKIIEAIYRIDALSEDEKAKIADIIKNNHIRKGLDDFTSPLDKSGYESIKIYNRDDDSLSITSSERSSFKFTPQDTIYDDDFNDNVSIIYLSPELTEWKFRSKAGSEFWAEVYDIDFLNRTKVKSSSALNGKFFYISGRKRTIKKFGAKKGKTTWTIEKAIEADEQGTLI
jgi:hypothetical protein